MNFDLNSLYGNKKIKINCGNCNNFFEVPFKSVIKDESKVMCPTCNKEITVHHDETTKKTINDTSKALKDLERSFKKLR